MKQFEYILYGFIELFSIKDAPKQEANESTIKIQSTYKNGVRHYY